MSDVPYTCSECERTESRQWVDPRHGGTDGSARVVGWRLGPGERGERTQWCPECAGVDEGYWDRMTLTTAFFAGIDAGNPVWTPVQ